VEQTPKRSYRDRGQPSSPTRVNWGKKLGGRGACKQSMPRKSPTRSISKIHCSVDITELGNPGSRGQVWARTETFKQQFGKKTQSTSQKKQERGEQGVPLSNVIKGFRSKDDGEKD